MKCVQYLLIEDIEALRKKLTNPKQWIHSRWLRTLYLVDHPDLWEPHPIYPTDFRYRYELPFTCMAYLVTGHRRYARQARGILLSALSSLDLRRVRGGYSDALFTHIWCYAAPVMRLAVFYDWVASSGVFTVKEEQRFCETFLQYAYGLPHLGYSCRPPIACNQRASMVLCAMTIGYLWGYKRGQHSLAREMFRTATARAEESVGYLPPGGYSGEGSGYMSHILTPAIALLTALREQIAGEDYFNKSFGPNGVSVRDALTMAARLVTPSGLNLSWDNSGPTLVATTGILAYLARRSGDLRWCDLARNVWGWQGWPSEILWGVDDRLWAMIWWPEEKNIKTTFFQPSWMEPNVGASLTEPGRQMQLFQMWDRCTAAPTCSRFHSNPNTVVLEAFGTPLLLDGISSKECTAFDDESYFDNSASSRMLLTVPSQKALARDPSRGVNFGVGTPNAHNCLIVEPERVHVPLREASGKCLLWHSSPVADIISSDATEFYLPNYAMKSVVRTSWLVKDAGYSLITDKVRAARSYRYAWRAYLRPEVAARQRDRISIYTQEGVWLHIVPLGTKEIQIESVEGYPNGLEGKSIRLDLYGHGSSIEMGALLFPEAGRVKLVDIPTGWRFHAESSSRQSTRWHRNDFDDSSWPTVRIDEAWYYQGVGKSSKIGWLRHHFYLPPDIRGKKLWLRLGHANGPWRLWVNGIEVPRLSYGSLNVVLVDISAAVRPGCDNLVVIRIEAGPEAALMESCSVYVSREQTTVPRISRQGLRQWKISHKLGEDHILSFNPEGKIRALGHWQTDAIAAMVRSGSHFVLSRARKLKHHGDILFQSTERIDVALAETSMHLVLPEHPAEFYLNVGGHSLHVMRHAALEIELDYRNKIRELTLETSRPLMCFLNGKIVEAHYDPTWGRQIVPLTPSLKTRSRTRVSRSVMMKLDAIATYSRTACPERIVGMLSDRSWLVRMAAVEAIGRMRYQEAASTLLRIAQREISRENPPRWCTKTIRAYRFRVELLTALGRLQYKPALPFLRRWLKESKRRGDLNELRGFIELALKAITKGAEFDVVKFGGENGLPRVLNTYR